MENKKQLKTINVKLNKSGELKKQWIKITDKIKELDKLQIKK